MNKTIIKPISIETPTEEVGLFLTTSQINELADELINHFGLDENCGVKSDGYRHCGTECSAIYKKAFPVLVAQDEMVYLQAHKDVCAQLDKHNISYCTKHLKNIKGNAHKFESRYIQLVSFNIVAVYLNTNLSIATQDIVKCFEILFKNAVTITTNNGFLVSGNKPVDIEDKPLVKILSQAQANAQANANPVGAMMDTPRTVGLDIPPEHCMEYVKTGVLIRHDLYVALKTASGMQRKPMYVILEELLTGASKISLDQFNYKKGRD